MEIIRKYSGRAQIRGKYLQFTWFASYIFILMIPMIFSVFIFLFVASGAKKEIGKANAVLLDQVQFAIDQHLADIKRLFNQIQLNSKIQILSMVDGEFSADDYYTLYESAKTLNSFSISNQFFDDIIVYFKNTKTVLNSSGHMSLELYYQLYAKCDEYSQDEFQTLLDEWSVNRITVMNINEKCRKIMFLKSNSFFGVMNAPSTIAVIVDESKILNMLDNIKLDPENIVFIFDGSGNVISSTVPHDSPLIHGLDKTEDAYTSEKKINSIRYTVSSIKSLQMDWRYVIMTPDYAVYRSLKKVQAISLASLLVCFIIGAAFSLMLVRLNYSPIKNLIGLFHRSSLKYDNDKNEIQWVHETIEEVLKERESIVNELRRSKQMYKNTALNKVLKGRYHVVNTKVKQMEFDSIGLNLSSPYFAVVLMNIEEMNYFSENPNDTYENLELAKFIIINVFNEICSEDFETETFEADGYATAIVGLKNDSREQLDIIIDRAYMAQQKLKCHFGIEMTIAIGDIASGINNISSSYISATEIMEYRSWLGLKEIIAYGDTKNLQNKYNYSIETENKVINYIRVGNREAVKALIFEVLDEHFTEEKISIGLAKCLVFDIVGTIIKALEYTGDLNLCDVLKTDDFNFLVKSSLPGIKAEFDKLINTICESTEQRIQTESRHDELSKNVMEYINANYKNPNMNISQIGYHFNLTPAYLSRIFKDQTGESLLSHINVVRVRAAEKLLYEGNNVTEAAEMVGFTNAGTMIRIFKKITGVTPGQLKKTR